MPTRERQNPVTDNERKNDGSISFCNGTGPHGKDCGTWTSILLPKHKTRVFMDRIFCVVFAVHPGLKNAKHRHNQITLILRV